MEYQKVTKKLSKVLKEILGFSSKDSYRNALYNGVKVDLEKGIITSTDGFKLAHVKMTDELKEIFEESGVFTVKSGMIDFEPIVSIEPKKENYPNVDSVFPRNDVIARFNMNPALLAEVIKYANKNQPIEFILYDCKDKDIKIPIELRFSVEDAEFDTIIMPMFSQGKKWSMYGREK